jgi:DNA-binding XRE family transcriptional regulator
MKSELELVRPIDFEEAERDFDKRVIAETLAKGERWNAIAATVLCGTRGELKVSQQELADRLGWTRNMVANLESGRRTFRLSDIFLIAEALRIGPEILFFRMIRWQMPLNDLDFKNLMR